MAIVGANIGEEKKQLVPGAVCGNEKTRIGRKAVHAFSSYPGGMQSSSPLLLQEDSRIPLMVAAIGNNIAY